MKRHEELKKPLHASNNLGGMMHLTAQITIYIKLSPPPQFGKDNVSFYKNIKKG